MNNDNSASASASRPTSAWTPRLAAGTQLCNRFQILDVLGRGAFTESYRATEHSDGEAATPLTLELVHGSLLADSETRALLDRSLAAVAALNHRNIARVHADGLLADGGNHFFVNEALDGISLRAMLDKRLHSGRAFSLKGAYNVVAHLTNALGYAHGTLIHGALTPESVIINAAGRVKIVDFGMLWLLAYLPDDEIGDGSAWSAIAPEIWAAPNAAGRQADVYSVGAILFELLTGRPPASSEAGVSQLVPGLPPAIDGVLARALKTHPEERFNDVDGLKKALDAALREPLAQAAAEVMPAAAPPVPMRPPVRPSRPPPPASPRPPSSTPTRPAPAQPAPGVAPPQGARHPGPPRYTSTLISVDEDQERWLIHKNDLDYGPYRLADVKSQIESDQVLGEHVIIDMNSGEQRPVKDHPLLRDLARLADERRQTERRKAADEERHRLQRRRNFVLAVTALAIILLGGGGTLAYILTRPGQEKTKIVYRDRDTEELLRGIEITMKVDPPTRTRSKRSGGASTTGGGRNAAGEIDDPTAIGDATAQGGDETLSQDVVQRVMVSNFRTLKGCVLDEKHRDAGLKNVTIDFVIRGTGQVSSLRANNDPNSALSTCLFSKMQAVAFPKFNGTKTHATFSLALK